MFQVSLGLPGAVLSQCPLLKKCGRRKERNCDCFAAGLGKIITIRKKLGEMSRPKRFWEIRSQKSVRLTSGK